MSAESLTKRRGIEEGIKTLPPLLIDVYWKFNLEPPRIPERLLARYPIIIIFGPPGGGKTKAAEKLGAHFGRRVLSERWQENEFVSGSYSRGDPEIALKSQIKFLLLKFQDYLEAQEISSQMPVFIEPSIETDTFYAQTFGEIGKITEEQYQEYLRIWEAMMPFVFPGDLAISVIPDEKTYDQRIRTRGRDYEQAGFTEDFKKRMIELCWKEEKKWSSQRRCLSIGHLDYVHGDIDPTLLIREFGLKATELWDQKEVAGTDGVKVLCPEGWKRFRIGAGDGISPDDCGFKRRSL
ncbi:MAG: deoxynucleoside kinase [Patescibacteria group bacterium]